MLKTEAILPTAIGLRRVWPGEPVLAGLSVSTELSRLLPLAAVNRLPPPAMVLIRVRGEAALGRVKKGGGPPLTAADEGLEELPGDEKAAD
jgi:hypothetical protein